LTTYQIVIKEKEEDLRTNREFRRKRGNPL